MRKAQVVCGYIALVCGNNLVRAGDTSQADQSIVSPLQAVSRLKEGNGRFSAGNAQHPHESSGEREFMATNSYENAGLSFLGMRPDQAAKRRSELTKSQHPFAIIVSCSDSRVPPEIIFDQGLGDLFVLRVAGNVINDESLGSIEYAVDHLAVRLIVTLGHQSCGAVKAAKETIAAKSQAPGHIQSLVKAIRPAVEATVNGDLDASIEANVKNVVQVLRSSTPVLKPKVDSGEVQIMGGNYNLETGVVRFLDEK